MKHAQNLLRSSALLAFSIVAALACATNAGQSDTRPEGLPEGINDEFLSQDLDVNAFVERFEGESREVYAARTVIVAALAIPAGSLVADIGAGTGFFSRLFAEAVGDRGSVYAVEISPNFLEHLRSMKSEGKIGTLQIVEGTGNSVELASASVDLAFICDVYHHFEEPSATLASLHDALRPGGSLVVIDFERIPGKSPDRLLEHVRAGKEVFRAEIEAAGFELADEIHLDELKNNYMLRFKRVSASTEN